MNHLEEEVWLSGTSNLLKMSDIFRPSPVWLWQSGKCVKKKI